MPADATSPAGLHGDVTAVAVRAQIDRVLASRQFARAEKLGRFLRFVTEETLEGRAASVKESVIGLAVFGRSPTSYDPGINPIVRVQAGRLRAKLLEYYAQEGTEDLLLIELPRGRYVPQFRLLPAPDAHLSAHRRYPGADVRRPNSVAVLPFVNLSSDPDNTYFSDGLTEELIHSLANVPFLHLSARSSAFPSGETGARIGRDWPDC